MAALNRQLIQAQSAVDRQTELLADSQVCRSFFVCFVKNINYTSERKSFLLVVATSNGNIPTV
jgi:hypothetical protein